MTATLAPGSAPADEYDYSEEEVPEGELKDGVLRPARIGLMFRNFARIVVILGVLAAVVLVIAGYHDASYYGWQDGYGPLLGRALVPLVSALVVALQLWIAGVVFGWLAARFKQTERLAWFQIYATDAFAVPAERVHRVGDPCADPR